MSKVSRSKFVVVLGLAGCLSLVQAQVVINEVHYDPDVKVEPVELSFEGKTVPGHKVTITPFIGETDNRRLARFLKKSYEFVVADAVPGGFYKVRSLVPAEADGGKALVEDEVIYSKIE